MPTNRSVTALAIAAVVLSAVILYTMPEARQAVFGKSALEKRAEEFSKQYGEELLVYSDDQNGFSIKYPVGYQVLKDSFTFSDSPAVTFRGRAGSEVEAIEVRTLPAFTREDFEKIASSYNEKEIKLKKETALNGKTAYLLNLELEDVGGLGKHFIRHAFVAGCKNEAGSDYSTSITAGIPESLAPDIALADYMISTFKC